MTISSQTIDQLKSADFHFAAGALAHAMGMQRASYGCHFGMRSDLERSKAEFYKGWDAAHVNAGGVA